MNAETSVYDYSARVSRARALMNSHNMDAILVTAGPDMIYFTGYTAYEGGWPIWLSAFVLTANAEPVLIISEMHRAIYEAKGSSWVQDVRAYMDGEDPRGLLSEVFVELGVLDGCLGVRDDMWFGDSTLLQAALPDVKLVSAGKLLGELRMIKDDDEIKHLRLANDYSAAGYQQARESIQVGRSEYEVALEIAGAMMASGSTKIGVGGHFRSCSHRTFQAGDPVDVDLSGQHNSYNSDTARMVFVGQPSGEVERMYRITLEAYEATLEKIRPGVCVADIHHVCAGYMAKHGYEQVWKVGHGVGLGPVHEAPLLEAGSELVLEPGMVFTVDPGCFMTGGYKDLPIHIEDNILVTSDGAVSISSYTLDMVVV